MICPYCRQEMQAGSLTGYARGGLSWRKPGIKYNAIELLAGKGSLKSAKYSVTGRLDLKADYCPGCKKLIIDTEIQK